MPSHRNYGSRALAAAALLSLGLVVGCGSSGSGPTASPTPPVSTTAPPTQAPSTTPTPTPAYDVVITVTYKSGRASGDTGLQKVKKGQRVAIVVTSDVADEIHLHTYDIKKDVLAGGTATLAFTATIPGRFECELESHGVRLTRIEVK